VCSVIDQHGGRLPYAITVAIDDNKIDEVKKIVKKLLMQLNE
jgi:hypothetical protein